MIKPSSGTRLVGARSANHTKFPFLVGMNQYAMGNDFTCSGFLITPSYYITAAHCNAFIKQHKDRDEKREECVQTTARGEFYTKGSYKHLKLKCWWLNDGDLEIRTEPKGQVWIGVNDKNIDHEKNAEKMVMIKGGAQNSLGGENWTSLENIIVPCLNSK